MSKSNFNYFEPVQQGHKPIKAWTKGVDLDERAHKQLENIAAMPFVHKHVAAMPDVHWGLKQWRNVMGETPNLRWFEELPKCGRCRKTAHGILRGSRNESYGHYCKKCANKRLKDSEKVRAKDTTP